MPVKKISAAKSKSNTIVIDDPRFKLDSRFAKITSEDELDNLNEEDVEEGSEDEDIEDGDIDFELDDNEDAEDTGDLDTLEADDEPHSVIDNEEEEEDEDAKALSLDTPKPIVKPLFDPTSEKAMKKHKKFVEKLAQKGIVHLPSVPPSMDPSTLRRLLSMHGAVERIYMTPEDASITRRRAKKGGKMRYVDAWVEFTDKRKAKKCALMLNGVQIGGSPRSRLYHALWSIKYLSGFKWSDLTEHSVHEKKVRELAIREEMTMALKETTHYLERVQEAKRQELRASKRPASQVEEQNDASKTIKRTFHQRPSIKGQKDVV